VLSEELVREIITRYDGDHGMLEAMMQDIQAEHGYLPPDQLKSLATQLEIPLTRVYGVAKFYSSFRLAPKAEHDVTLCMGTVCHVAGAPEILEGICGKYKLESGGGTTDDRFLTMEGVNCVGACAVAPVMVVDGTYHEKVTPESALSILSELSGQKDEEAS
jgi:NADH-quinone oxidoreductase subunit E